MTCSRRGIGILGLALLLRAGLARAGESCETFRITILDSVTRRGIPLVLLETTSGLPFVSDSAGTVAFREPGLFGREVYFAASSHGYEVPADGLGERGFTLVPVPGGQATVLLERKNLAERLYRVTGEGIYRDTVLTGGSSPIARPLGNAQVTGQDSVQCCPYRGELFWIWGDTNRTSYALGNFAATGARSKLPGRGGLPAQTGIDLEYVSDGKGFTRKMCPLPGEGPVWLDAVMVVPDERGTERLLARYSRPREPEEKTELGLAFFDDQAGTFRRLVRFPGRPGMYTRGYCCAHPFRVSVGGSPYIYFAMPFPGVRVKEDFRHVIDPGAYEAYTCLDPDGSRVRRGKDGKPEYRWVPGGKAMGSDEVTRLMEAGTLAHGEACFDLRDTATGKRVKAKSGSVFYNDYKKRWIMIVQEVEGTSFLGEVWYAQAETPVGPWSLARKIVTHERYSFYNPAQHPYFDQTGGRIIYFEGTYASTFSGNPDKTPLYDYNQVMYRLDLSLKELELAVPAYRIRDGSGADFDRSVRPLPLRGRP